MIRDYLKAGYPALCVLTYEPYRAEQLLPCEGWRFLAWDCVQGIKDLESRKILEEIRDPVAAVNWLNEFQDTVLLAHNLHLFMDIPEVIQSIQNGVPRWKATGSSLVMISPVIRMCPEVDKYFHVIDLPLPGENELFALQGELGKQTNIETDHNAARAAMGLSAGSAMRSPTPGRGRRAEGSCSEAASAPPTATPEEVSVRPYVVSTGRPSTSASQHPGRDGPAAEQDGPQRGRAVRPSSVPSSCSSWVGTSDRCVTPAAMRLATSAGSNRSTTSSGTPQRLARIMMARPATWKSGRQASQRSCGSRPEHARPGVGAGRVVAVAEHRRLGTPRGPRGEDDRGRRLEIHLGADDGESTASWRGE